MILIIFKPEVMVDMEPYLCFGPESVPMGRPDGLQPHKFRLFKTFNLPCYRQDAGAYGVRILCTCVRSNDERTRSY